MHCGDENPAGQPTLSGYPIECDRLEAQQIDNLASWFATAVVNRIDLTPQDGTHCGNQRLIFANNAALGNGRMFMIIEAQLPNANPASGAAGCLPVAEFWNSLESVADPVQRGATLREAFLVTGVPGIGPFMNAAHLSCPFLLPASHSKCSCDNIGHVAATFALLIAATEFSQLFFPAALVSGWPLAA